MKKGFFVRLAWRNITHSREIFLPYYLATAVIAGLYFLCAAMMFTKSLSGVPGGETTQQIFMFAAVLLSVLAFAFMLYINGFLIKRRKREFGLYGVLGLEKRHVAHVLRLESLMVLGGGVVTGVLLSAVLGRLWFRLLMRLIGSVAGGSFTIPPVAYMITAALFIGVFAVTYLLNLGQISLSSPIALLSSEKRGETRSRLLIPVGVLGLLLLGACYYLAATIQQSSVAALLFILLALLVIAATYLVFIGGSYLFLRLLKGNKKLYYTSAHFVAISGMFHRMKQNAAGLATICVLSTMTIVTVAGVSALYTGRENTVRTQYPYDCHVYIYNYAEEQADIDKDACDAFIAELAAESGVTAVPAPEKLSFLSETEVEAIREKEGYVPVNILLKDGGQTLATMPHASIVFYGSGIADVFFDVEGSAAQSEAFSAAFSKSVRAADTPFGPDCYVECAATARADFNGLYGGLVFLAIFFSLMFLTVTVLVIYFKQITEGYEDRQRFAILQQVGMDETQVKRTIDKQILWVFFLPLGGAFLHLGFATPMLIRALRLFSLSDPRFMIVSAIVTAAAFALAYLLVFRLTATQYYRIVKRKIEA